MEYYYLEWIVWESAIFEEEDNTCALDTEDKIFGMPLECNKMHDCFNKYNQVF